MCTGGQRVQSDTRKAASRFSPKWRRLHFAKRTCTGRWASRPSARDLPSESCEPATWTCLSRGLVLVCEWCIIRLQPLTPHPSPLTPFPDMVYGPRVHALIKSIRHEHLSHTHADTTVCTSSAASPPSFTGTRVYGVGCRL